MTYLDAQLVVQRGDFTLNIALAAAAGEVVALLGPNGAGKTTALRALAGLIGLSGGALHLDGAVLDDPESKKWVPPENRNIGVVFQDYLLFPHLSVVDNVAFGPSCRGMSTVNSRALAIEWLERVGLADMAKVRPRALSGGQAQRVALARALASEPRLLLLDEPLSALDAQTRVTVRSELRRHLAEFAGCAVVITHDPLDAMVLADRLVVIESGAAVQEGTPSEVARRPRTPYVAKLVGLNLLRGTATDGGVAVSADGIVLAAQPVPASEAFVAFRPAAVALYRQHPEGSPRNVWPGTVEGVESYGDTYRVQVAGPVPLTADVTAAAVAELGLSAGMPVWASVKATEVDIYPA